MKTNKRAIRLGRDTEEGFQLFSDVDLSENLEEQLGDVLKVHEKSRTVTLVFFSSSLNSL